MSLPAALSWLGKSALLTIAYLAQGTDLEVSILYMCLKLYKLITSLFKVANSRQPRKPGRFKLAGSCATDKAKSIVPRSHFTWAIQDRQWNKQQVQEICPLVYVSFQPWVCICSMPDHLDPSWFFHCTYLSREGGIYWAYTMCQLLTGQWSYDASQSLHQSMK